MRLHLSFLILVLVASQAVAGTPLTFRGLSSKSTWADVKSAFPAAEIRHTCNKGQTMARSANGVTLCDQLITTYDLDQNTYKATFIFNPNRTLRYVSLLKFFGEDGLRGSKQDIPTASSTANSLADLLSTKYGPPVIDPPGSLLRLKSEILLLEWQPGRGVNWQSGGDRIKLEAEAIEAAKSSGKYIISVQLFYTFARYADVGGL